MVSLAILACVVFGFALVAGRLEGSVVTAPMIFVAAGLVAGWTGLLDLSMPSHAETSAHIGQEAVLVAAELALVLLLFTSASGIKPSALRGNPLPARLLCLGLPLTIALGTLVAFLLFDGLAFWECAIVAAVLAPTDAALGQAVVSNQDLPQEVREGLEVESGLNDGGTVPLLTLFIALAAVEEGVEGGWVQFAIEQIGLGALVGAAIGAAGGWVLRWASERDYTEPLFEKLALAALAIIVYVAAGEVGGNGFIAAFVGGAAAGVTAGAVSQMGRDFAEEEGELLNLTIFFIFGIYAATAIADVTWAIAAYAVLSLTVVRMVPVALALIGVGLRAPTVAFVGWFGPRGLASIILGLVVVDDANGLAGLSQIFVIMVATVLLSVFAHGVTAAPLSRRLAAAKTD